MEKFILRLSSHEANMCKTLCSLMESQILVDLTINCKSYSLKIHKCVLAAKSGYFREKLQKDVTIDRVLINGMKPSVLKSLITFIYCGGTSVAAEDMHDLISAAEYFRVSGIMSILKDKFKMDVTKKSELNLEETPPIFFSNNAKVNSTKYNYNTMPIGVLSGKCNAPGKSKEARYLLVKEQTASQLTLEALHKNKSKVVVVSDEICTEVTVEAELSPDFDDTEPVQEFILEDFNKNALKPTNGQLNEVFVLQPDSAQPTVSYQLISQDKDDLEIQQYICNTISDYTVNATSSNANVCYDIIPDEKIQMTYAEISSAAVSDVTYSSNIETVTVIENINNGGETPRIIANYNSNVENQSLTDEYKASVETSAVNSDYSASDIYIVNDNNNVVIEHNDNVNYLSNLESAGSVIEKCNDNVESDTDMINENVTVEKETETVPENNNTNSNINNDTNSVDELILLSDSQDSTSSNDLSQKSYIIPVSQEVIVPDTDDDEEDYSDNSIFATNGHCSIMDKILPNYDNDNASANKSVLKRKYDDILRLDSTCNNDENNIDLSKPVKFLKNNDSNNETDSMKSLRSNYSLFSIIKSQDKENITPSNNSMTENIINDQKCIYDDQKIVNFTTSTVNDFLNIENPREENRRQTRSSAKRLS